MTIGLLSDHVATIVYEGPDGTVEERVGAGNISDSGKVQGIRVKLEDGSYVHVPYARLYRIAMTEDEGRVDSTP